MSVGKELKRIREVNKISAGKLAAFVGINADRLRKWEALGTDPKQEDSEKIEAYFKVPIEELKKIGKFQFIPKNAGDTKVKAAEGKILEALIRMEAQQLAHGAYISEIYGKLFDVAATKVLKDMEQMGKDEARKLLNELQ